MIEKNSNVYKKNEGLKKPLILFIILNIDITYVRGIGRML